MSNKVLVLGDGTGFKLDTNSKNTDFNSVFVNYFIRFHMAIHNRVFKIIIGINKFKTCIRQLVIQTFNTIVKIMVANGCQIIFHQAHQFEF